MSDTGYAIAIVDRSPSEHYADVLKLLAQCPIAGISLEYEQPGHTPEILAACGDMHVILGLLDRAIAACGTCRARRPTCGSLRLRRRRVARGGRTASDVLWR
jgi:hypothetical protein